MSVQNDILEVLNQRGQPVKTSGLAEALKKPSSTIRGETTRLKHKGYIDGSSEEGWLITDEGKKALEKGVHPTMIDEEVTPRQQFEAIGRHIGIKEERIVLATDIVWSGEYNDIKWVWEALGQADIANDLRRVWVNAWRAKLQKAIPSELEIELTGGGKTAADERGKGVTPAGRGREYIIVDDEPVRVGENLGDYTLQDAKDILSIRALRNRFAGPAQAGAGPASATEKVSELLVAMEPYINKGSDKDALKEMLVDKLALVRQDILSRIPQQAQTAPPKTFMEQLTGFIGVMGQMKEAGPALKSILGVPETSANPPSGIPVTVTGPDGKPAVMDLTQMLDFRKFMAEEKRADESHETRLEVAKGFKDLLGKAGTAMSHMSEGEEGE